MKKVIVLGGGGFIGHHLINSLISEGCWVRGVDLKFPEYEPTRANDCVIGNLTQQDFVNSIRSCLNFSSEDNQVFDDISS